jgi:hypothetical protein
VGNLEHDRVGERAGEAVLRGLSLEQHGCGFHTNTDRSLMVSAGQVVLQRTIRRIRPVTSDIEDL